MHDARQAHEHVAFARELAQVEQLTRDQCSDCEQRHAQEDRDEGALRDRRLQNPTTYRDVAQAEGERGEKGNKGTQHAASLTRRP